MKVESIIVDTQNEVDYIKGHLNTTTSAFFPKPTYKEQGDKIS